MYVSPSPNNPGKLADTIEGFNSVILVKLILRIRRWASGLNSIDKYEAPPWEAQCKIGAMKQVHSPCPRDPAELNSSFAETICSKKFSLWPVPEKWELEFTIAYIQVWGAAWTPNFFWAVSHPIISVSEQ